MKKYIRKYLVIIILSLAMCYLSWFAMVYEGEAGAEFGLWLFSVVAGVFTLIAIEEWARVKYPWLCDRHN
ncbi:MAG: hypothetical protein KUG81_01475 [Gammaproteobacteria bacterium]|nr:hypothetical protein [Gammaproteobacteria bacterium]